MARVYLDSSFFGACVSTRTGVKPAYWREVSNQWWESQRQRHDVFISDEVVAELSHPNFAERDAALAMLSQLPTLELCDLVLGFAAVLVREQVMPGPAVSGDAIHVAVATVHRVEYLLSWNVQHLANPRKSRHLAANLRSSGIHTAPDRYTGPIDGDK